MVNQHLQYVKILGKITVGLKTHHRDKKSPTGPEINVVVVDSFRWSDGIYASAY